MLTGYTEIERVMEARDSGITEFLAKPISARTLYSRLCSVVDQPRSFVNSEEFAGPDRRRFISDTDSFVERRGVEADEEFFEI
jgi:FixJ family two-component response regulator